MTKIAGSGSISQRHGSEDPDPDPLQNVMDPQHCRQGVESGMGALLTGCRDSLVQLHRKASAAAAASGSPLCSAELERGLTFLDRLLGCLVANLRPGGNYQRYGGGHILALVSAIDCFAVIFHFFIVLPHDYQLKIFSNQRQVFVAFLALPGSGIEKIQIRDEHF